MIQTVSVPYSDRREHTLGNPHAPLACNRENVWEQLLGWVRLLGSLGVGALQASALTEECAEGHAAATCVFTPKLGNKCKRSSTKIIQPWRS